MGLPVTVYRHTDVGAPQLTSGTPSEWIAILKACLVNGYGAKAGLGWTLEFEDAGAYKAAFRNSVADGGSGGYVQFWSSTGANAANTSMNFKSALEMTALDVFNKAGTGRMISFTSGIKGWEIIGSSRGFYIIVHYMANTLNAYSTSTAAYYQNYFIGDIHSTHSNDVGVFTIISTNNSNGDLFNTSCVGICSTQDRLYCRLYALDGSSSSYFYKALKSNDANISSLDGNAELLGVNHVMVPFLLTGVSTTSDAVGTPQNASLLMPYCRGAVPGLYMSTFAGYRSENWPTELVRDGETWVLLRTPNYTGYWIRTGTWYD